MSLRLTAIKLISAILAIAAVCPLHAEEPLSSFRSVAKKSKLEFLARTTAFVQVSGSAPLPDVAAHLKTVDGKRIIELSKITLSVNSLKTGLAVRDKHMYEKVFSTGGSTPPIVVEAVQVPLPPSSGTKGFSHPFEVTFRGKTKPCVFSIDLVEKDGQLISGRATGKVSLQDHGVPEISYLGVTVKDEVDLVVTVVFEKSSHLTAANDAR